MTAKIDAAGSGQYAEVDTQGRYTVIVPFDTSGRKDGKASAPVRMAQPYAGSDHGMHFPLHKGTEVLLAFIDGDPDRPIIQSAVPNPETPSPVNVDNQTMSAITRREGTRYTSRTRRGPSGYSCTPPTRKATSGSGRPMTRRYRLVTMKKITSGGTPGIAESAAGSWTSRAKENARSYSANRQHGIGMRIWFTFGGRLTASWAGA